MCDEPDKLTQTHGRRTVMKTTVSNPYFAFFLWDGKKIRSLPEKGVKLS